MKKTLKKIVAFFMVLHLLGICTPGLASAALIGTERAVASEERERNLERIGEILDREDVRGKFIEHGVSPDEARLRVAALSDAELRQLQAGLDALPTGGDSVLWVLGVVFLVLLVLEIVGVINVFTGI